jgi:hypothetical protein
MSMPSGLARCANVLWTNGHPAPRQPVIYGWVVAAAAAAAVLLVLFGVGLIYALGRLPGGYRVEHRRTIQLPAAPVLTVAAQPVAATAPQAPEPDANEADVDSPAPARPHVVLTPEARVVQPTHLPQSELALGQEVPDGETYGTKVLFLRNPEVAAQQALKARKLLFVLHLSGNFEDACFT